MSSSGTALLVAVVCCCCFRRQRRADKEREDGASACSAHPHLDLNDNDPKCKQEPGHHRHVFHQQCPEQHHR